MSSCRVHDAAAFFVRFHVLGVCKVSIVVVVVVLIGRRVSVVIVGVVAVELLWSVMIASSSVVVSIALTVHRFWFPAV